MLFMFQKEEQYLRIWCVYIRSMYFLHTNGFLTYPQAAVTKMKGISIYVVVERGLDPV